MNETNQHSSNNRLISALLVAIFFDFPLRLSPTTARPCWLYIMAIKVAVARLYTYEPSA